MSSNIPDVENVPVVILCGGEGVRFYEETQSYPKPLIKIGESPILLHLIRIYICRGFKKFILCLGYKGAMIKDFFLNYTTHTQDFSLRMDTGKTRFYGEPREPDYEITFVETGASTSTGGRIKRIQKYVDTEYFMVTYADGLADIDPRVLMAFHLSHGKIGTVTGVKSLSQFGELVVENQTVIKFAEKSKVESIINGGFLVFSHDFFNYLSDSEDCILEREPLEKLTEDSQLNVYRHDGFWCCMDTYKDLRVLTEIWSKGNAPWYRAC